MKINNFMCWRNIAHETLSFVCGRFRFCLSWLYPKATLGLALENLHVVCGLGPGRTFPHNRRFLRHCGQKQSRLSWTAAVESNSSVCFKCVFQTCLKQGSSQQTQGVVVAALNRWHELRVRCAASALHSSAEAASLVLSTSSESWIARVGRANSSTWHRSHQKCVPLNLMVLANCPGTLVGSLNLHLEQHSVLSKAECVNPKVSLLLSDQLVLTYFVLRILPFAPINKHLNWLKSDVLIPKRRLCLLLESFGYRITVEAFVFDQEPWTVVLSTTVLAKPNH